jgi:hypothetical protein
MVATAEGRQLSGLLSAAIWAGLTQGGRHLGLLHLTLIFAKLNVIGSLELVIYTYRHGLSRFPP